MNEAAIDRAVEFNRAADVDAAFGDAVTDADYPEPPPLIMGDEDWRRDCADHLLAGLSDEQLIKLRTSMSDLMWWDHYMMRGEQGATRVSYMGNMAAQAMDIAALLMKSLETNGITLEMMRKRS